MIEYLDKGTGKESSEAVSQLYWCEDCRVPLYGGKCECCGAEGRKFVKDARVVFPEEKMLLEILLGMDAGELNEASVWNASGNVYYRDGERLPLRISGLKELDSKEIRAVYDERIAQKDDRGFQDMVERFIKANHSRYVAIEKEAMDYIKEETKDFDSGDMFISFSGGKDSTVVADLAKRALGNHKILHIYGDTTLEFPMTEQYVKEYRKENPGTLMLSSRNKEKNFEDLCEMLGPPSRVMRWCCTVFKTGAINQKIVSLFAKHNRIVAFQGIRHSESASRSKYERTSMNSKIAKQVTLCPIIDWFDFDVWLYILTRKILFNSAYRLGYARVGCYCCPNNSFWSEFLSSVFIPEEYDRFQKLLLDFAKKVGKKDADVYVREGKWKARQGGNGLEYARKSIVSFEPCVKEENAFNYELTKPIEDALYELFKPFGTINMELGNKRLGEVYVIGKDGTPVLTLQGRKGQNRLKVSIHNIKAFRARNIQAVRERIDCQITKYQMCMGCKACESVCRFNAITVRECPDGTTEYRINEDKCVKCQECVGHFSVGCYMRKVLTIKRN